MNKEPKTWVQYDRTLPYIEDRDPGQKPVSHLELLILQENFYIIGLRETTLLTGIFLSSGFVRERLLKLSSIFLK